jgi:hypothetical protein
MTETPPLQDWQRAIRERLLRRSADLDWVALWPEVVGARTELLEAIAGISEEQAAWKPSPADWSIAETVRHQLPSSAGVVAIIRALTAGRDPAEDTPYDDPGEVTAHEVAPAFEGLFADLRRAFTENSITFAALPALLPAESDLERTFPHMYFGPLPARAWFAFQRVHDRAHLRQVEEIVSADGFPA